jgi:hypothetical protein
MLYFKGYPNFIDKVGLNLAIPTQSNRLFRKEGAVLLLGHARYACMKARGTKSKQSHGTPWSGAVVLGKAPSKVREAILPSRHKATASSARKGRFCFWARCVMLA